MMEDRIDLFTFWCKVDMSYRVDKKWKVNKDSPMSAASRGEVVTGISVIRWFIKKIRILKVNMDELQDALEDAQYVNAMHDAAPRPTKEWKVQCHTTFTFFVLILLIYNCW